MFESARPHKAGANVKVHDEQNPAPIAPSSETENLAEAADPLPFPSLTTPGAARRAAHACVMHGLEESNLLSGMAG